MATIGIPGLMQDEGKHKTLLVLDILSPSQPARLMLGDFRLGSATSLVLSFPKNIPPRLRDLEEYSSHHCLRLELQQLISSFT